MKNYRITVNGVAYDVSVEETNEVSSFTAPAPSPAPIKKAAAPSPAQKTVAMGKTVAAQVPGKITNIVAKVGQSIKTGDTVIMLEAMKMEIPVVSSVDGVVSSILVNVGQNVEAGESLVALD